MNKFHKFFLKNLFYQINSPKNKLKLTLIILIFAILLRILLIFILPLKPEFDFQQELYKEYIYALQDKSINDNNLSNYDKRLFPGIIVLILIVNPIINNLILSGILISLLSFIFCFIILKKLINKLLPLLILSIFPPMWVITNVKSATETVTATLLLASIYLYNIDKLLFSGIIIGLAYNFRPISICLLGAIILFSIIKKKYQDSLKIILGFLITAPLMLLYNYFIFGTESLFIQFQNVEKNYGMEIGFIQILNDINRTILWGQHRILFSGIFYIVISFMTLFILFKIRNRSKLYYVLFLWVLFSILFIFTFSPFTLIENYFRYILVFAPAIAIAFSEAIYKLLKKINFN